MARGVASRLSTGIRLDFHPNASVWHTRGIAILNEAFYRQVFDDGVHAERNPGYHSWMTIVYHRYWRIARAMPELGLRVDTQRLARMFDYALAVTRPNGDFNALHDSNRRTSGPNRDTWPAKRAHFPRPALWDGAVQRSLGFDGMACGLRPPNTPAFMRSKAWVLRSSQPTVGSRRALRFSIDVHIVQQRRPNRLRRAAEGQRRQGGRPRRQGGVELVAAPARPRAPAELALAGVRPPRGRALIDGGPTARWRAIS